MLDVTLYFDFIISNHSAADATAIFWLQVGLWKTGFLLVAVLSLVIMTAGDCTLGTVSANCMQKQV